MANVPEQRVKISVEETQFLSGTTESFMERFAAASNWIALNVSPQPVGSILYSKMNEAQLQVVKGSGWILSDGRNVTGSAYAALTGINNCVDLRGIHIRGQNNGRSDGLQNPDGTALRAFQVDATNSHNHATVAPTNCAGTVGSRAQSTSADYRNQNRRNSTTNITMGGGGGAPQMIAPYGVMNAFVRIN